MKFISNNIFKFLLLLILSASGATIAQAQSAGNANMKYIAIKSSGCNYLFDQFASFASMSTPANKEVENIVNWGGYHQPRGITSDGDRWYSILKSPTQNCFVTYTSYKNVQTSQGELYDCVNGNDGYRGLAYDGKLFYKTPA